MFAVCANAQAITGMLIGSVYDETGQPLAGAKVTAINELNGHTRSTITERDGSYRIPALPPGRYTIRASMAGFADGMHTNFPVPLGAKRTFVPPITLTNAATAAAAAPAPLDGDARSSLVTTGDPTRRANFTLQQLSVLPLGATTETRSFDEAALLASGVAPAPYTPGVRGPGVGFGLGTAGQFSVNGMRGRSNNFTVDGSDNNDPDVGVRRQGFVALVPQPIESVQEMRIATLLWDAESGRNFGGQVDAVSRSGGNELHGMLYGFFTDSSLAARNFFDYEGGPSEGESPYTRVQAGAVIGFPIAKDRTQVFASVEYLGINALVEQHFASPLAAERAIGQFVVLNPAPGLSQFDLRTLQGASPIGVNVFSFYPLPNNFGGPYGDNTYTALLPASGNGVIVSGRVTHEITDAHAVSVRYNFTDDDRTIPSVNRAIASTIVADTRTQDLSIILDSALSPKLFNVARFSYGRTRLRFPEHPSSPFVFSSTRVFDVIVDGVLRGVESKTSPLGELHVEPFSPVGVDAFNFPQARVNNPFQFADTLSYTAGRHGLKFGFDIRRVQLNSSQDRNYRPLVTFGHAITLLPEGPRFDTGAQTASIGLPSSIRQTITTGVPDSTIGLRFTEVNLFVNDNWRVHPRVTVDAGLRYELNTVPREVNSRIEDALSLVNVPAGGNSVVDAAYPQFSAALQSAFDDALDAYRTVLAGRTRIYDGDHNNFAPHLGFAWDVAGDGRTTVRGGYAVRFDTILGAVVSQSRNVFPTEIPITVDPAFLPFNVFDLNVPSRLLILSPEGDPLVSLIAPGTLNQFGGRPEDFVAQLGALFLGAPQSGLAFTLPDKDLATPYVQQWHLTVERQVSANVAVSVAYVGTKGTKLTRLTTPNLGPNVTPLIPARNQGGRLVIDGAEVRTLQLLGARPEPALGAYQIFENSAASSYHALQLEARKRYSQGFTFTAAYTWSHAIDDVSDVFPIAGAPVIAADSSNLRLERADAGFDVRHRFAGSGVWDLPYFRDADGLEGLLLGDWQVATIFQASSGQPFTLNVPFDANFDGNFTDRAATTDGLVFLDGHDRQKVAIATGVPVSSFYAVGFVDGQPVGGVGAVGRNTARGDGFIGWDLAAEKAFTLGESRALRLRVEVFNVLNRANFGLPIRVVGAPGFGGAVETAAPARVVQLAAKFSF